MTKDSRLVRGSSISRDVFKKLKANMLRKMKHCKVDGAPRVQWMGANVVEEEEEAFADASEDSSDDDYSDALRMLYEEDPSESENKSASTAEPEEPTDDQQKEDDHCCPLCDEEMDTTDLHFKPCSSCEFKMCLFCYKKITDEGTGVCPGCRKKYEEETSAGPARRASHPNRGLGHPN